MRILDDLSDSSVIKDPRYLDHSFVPEEVLITEEMRRVAYHFKYTLSMDKYNFNLLVVGPTGTGKTLTVKKLSEECGDEINTLYVSGAEGETTYNTFRLLSSQLGTSIPRRGLSLYDAVSSLSSSLPKKKTIIIIDDADKIIDYDRLMTILTRWNETKDKKISFIVISNSVYFLNKMDVSTRSRIQDYVYYDWLNADEIRKILEMRASRALYREAYSDSVLGLLSALTTKKRGDAKLAIASLKVSAYMAEESGSGKITEEIVRESVRIAEEELEEEAVRKLPPHQILLLYSLAKLIDEEKEDHVSLGKVYSKYVNVCLSNRESPVKKRQFYNLVSYLQSSGFIFSIKGKGKRLYLALNVPKGIVFKVFRVNYLGESETLDKWVL